MVAWSFWWFVACVFLCVLIHSCVFQRWLTPSPTLPIPWAHTSPHTGREALSVILERRRAEQQGRGGSLCRDVDGSGPACEIPAESKV